MNSIACKTCGQVHAFEAVPPGMVARCVRCGSTIERRTPLSLDLTAAFSLAGPILYIPANIFPILRLEMYGAVSENTVWDGCVRLDHDGDFIIALIVFLASIFIPILKLIGLLMLVFAARFKVERWRLQLTWIYKIIEAIGRWAMLDVFVLAVLVSLVSLERAGHHYSRERLVCVRGVVVCTVFASACFDPQLIWEHEETAR